MKFQQVLVRESMKVVKNDESCGTVGDVLPGSLLGPILGLAFSTDGDLLFAGSGSSISTYNVRSGALLSTARVFTSGVAVCGIDVGRESFGAIFGDRCVRIVDGVPTGADSLNTAVARFRVVVRLPDLDDRVWDARLICGGEKEKDKAGQTSTSSAIGNAERPDGGNTVPCQAAERATDPEEGEGNGRKRGGGAGMGLVAIALAHNSVEVWDWASQTRPLRIRRARGGDPCLLYHARLWGRTLDDLRVAAGTVFNQVLVWIPGEADTAEPKRVCETGGATDQEFRGGGAGRIDVLPRRISGVLRLSGHEGVIFRVAWREDGRRLASASDDRTVRVWDVECNGGDGDGSDDDEWSGMRGKNCNGRLLWTGWGHASRVWDVGFTRLGIVTCGEDGAAILWREKCPFHENSTTCSPGNTTVAAPQPTSANPAAAAVTTTSTPAISPEPRLDGQPEGAQLVPAAFLRGHSGASVWRLAVHEFAPRCSSSSSIRQNFAAGDSTHEERGNDWWGLTLMATGGNDGVCKLWDLEFERTFERRQISGERKDGILWGQTKAIPTDQSTGSIDAHTAAGKNKENGHPTPAVTAPLPATIGTSLAVASSTMLPADRNERHDEKAAAAVDQGSTSNPTEPSSNAPSPRTTPFQQSISGDKKHSQRGGQGLSGGGASRRRDDRRRRKPVVVREVRLVRGCSRTAATASMATAAALLLADGSVWWVSDLHIGSWQQVTVSAGGAAAVDGVTEGCLLSSGISAIAVVELLEQRHAEANPTPFGSDGVAMENMDGGGNEVAIVAGRDDGRLFLLTQRRPPPTVFSEANSDVKPGSATDDGRGDRAASPSRPWRVSAAWEGHRSRVTSVWLVGDAAHSRILNAPEGESQGLTAALDTSRLFSSSSSEEQCYGRLYGALVSAGADGTVAWWEWARAEPVGGVADDGSPSSCRKLGGEVTVCAPRSRMVCRAGPGAAITSVAIDDRRQRCRHSVKKTTHREAERNHIFTGEKPKPDAQEDENGAPSPAGAVVFCGDTKGNIRCFLEEPRDDSLRFDGRTGGGEEGGISADVGERGALREGLPPSLVLKRQHGKDQISRLALRGDCLFSAGHDGQIHQYVISYSSPSFDRLAEPQQRNSPVGTDTSSRPVDLTIVTTYATAPVTAVSELWVGNECGRRVEGDGDARPRWEGEGGETVRLAVAGRSGSSRMSVWDITGARQILDLECGDRHLAHDLFLSWPSIKRAPICLASTLDQPRVSSATTIAPKVNRNTYHENRHEKAVGPSSFESDAAPHSPKNVLEVSTPLLELPRHTFVSAQPISGTKVNSVSSSNLAGKIRAGGTAGETKTRGPPVDTTCPKQKNSSPQAAVGGAREHRHQQRHPLGQARDQHQQRGSQPGVMLAFHSSFFPVGCGGLPPPPPPATGDRSQVLQQEPPRERRAATEVVVGSSTAWLGSACDATAAIAAVVDCSAIASGEALEIAAVVEEEDESEDLAAGDDRQHLALAKEVRPDHFLGHDEMASSDSETIRMSQRGRNGDGGGGSDGLELQLPGRFRYSLGEPFHSQRVASVRFILPGTTTARGKTPDGKGGRLNLRLVTGGEDGAVKLLDVFYKSHRHTSNPPNTTDDPGRHRHSTPSPRYSSSASFYRPCAKVVQTLPSHESSVGALGVGICRGGGDPYKVYDPTDLQSTLVVSGGGKMEARAWSIGGVGDQSGIGAGRYGGRRATKSTSCAPPVRWLSTTTPAPKSPLHAHRIMCLCVLPPPPLHLRRPSAYDTRGSAVFLAGDSGGGVTVFELQHGAVAATGSAAAGSTAAAPAPVGEEQREARARPAGRWMALSERPVLCLAHARVPVLPELPSPAPQDVVDLIVTGDTGGTVTVWEFLSGGSGGCILPYNEGKILRQGVPGVRGGFVHRGPAGKRRGGTDMGAEGGAGEKYPSCPGLVPVLEYRAHQMGVLCVAVHVPPRGGRMVIASGGDDQAICVAELELSEQPAKSSDQASRRGVEERDHTCGSSEKTPASKRRFTARLVGGEPEVTNGAAGSAIKGIHVFSAVPPVKYPVVDQHPAPPQSGFEPHATAKSPGVPGFKLHRPPVALSVFTISRDQRLSRWDLMEEDEALSASISETPGVVVGANDRQSSDGSTLGDDAGASSSAGLGDEGNGATGNADIGVPSGDVPAVLSQLGERGLRQQRVQQDKKEEQRRWRLRWRAGCVTDVCDISGLDAVPLADDSHQQEAIGDESSHHLPCSPSQATLEGGEGATVKLHEEVASASSPAALVAVSGQGLQLVIFGAC